ncbi:acetyltransferase [Thalassotalea sp. PP2-459]|uniref:acetyltransferase n=1 Tax=Thalassotalea sp. PP2-459 TaxID=1742724 RepID=UPI0009426350|nr:acetyltransferase [Thalassotalea sp. PP2-459]OKY24630.1 acetyltransferase [Thalassotalea sp. PP2-459]
MHYDIFNGDADGIISLVQLRLANPKESTLITGVKRDISLLKHVDVAKAHSVTALDISMEKNIEALNELLANNVTVFYADHHRPSSIPTSDNLSAHIDTDANTCTALIVNQYLNQQFPLWAITAAYGDNMLEAAQALSDELNLSTNERDQLKRFGIYINYNGYGSSLEDLHFTPEQLFRELVKYSNPFDIINQPGSVFSQLEQAYHQDMANAEQAKVLAENDVCKVIELPDEPWSRRVSGVLGNELANKTPNKAHAVFTLNLDHTYTVSLRAPLTNKQGAGDICARFATGGGRAAAAGINQLAAENVNAFVTAISDYYR